MDLHLLVDGQAVWLPAAALLGLGVGFIAGMFGVGGGFLLVPLMHVFLSVPLPTAVGVGLCQTIATALGSHLRHRKFGNAETRFDIMLIGGSLFGVDAGARLLRLLEAMEPVSFLGREVHAHRPIVTGMYAVLFLVMAALLWWRDSPGADEEIEPGPLARLRLPPAASLPTAGLSGISGPLVGLIGFANGVLAGLIGVGGGIVLIPIMLYGFGFNIRKVAGTGIIVVLVVGVVGTVQHARMGNVHLGLAVTLMIGAALAAQIGATLTRSLSARALRRGLAVVLVLTIAALVFKLLR